MLLITKIGVFAASSQDSEQTKVKIQKLTSVSFALCTVLPKFFLIVTPACSANTCYPHFLPNKQLI